MWSLVKAEPDTCTISTLFAAALLLYIKIAQSFMTRQAQAYKRYCMVTVKWKCVSPALLKLKRCYFLELACQTVTAASMLAPLYIVGRLVATARPWLHQPPDDHRRV